MKNNSRYILLASALFLLFVQCDQELSLKTPKPSGNQIEKNKKYWHEFILQMKEDKSPALILPAYTKYEMTIINKLTPHSNFWLLKARIYSDELTPLLTLLKNDLFIEEVQSNGILNYK